MQYLILLFSRLRFSLLGLIVGTALLVGCNSSLQPPTSSSPEQIAVIYQNRPKLRGTATLEMQVQTASGLGTVTLQLEGNAAPLTAGNFVQLAADGFYDGLSFHRVVKDPLPFVVQAGDPLGNGTGGFVDPQTQRPRQIPLEIATKSRAAEDVPQFKLHYNEVVQSPALALPHHRGAIAMARSTAFNTASSQFYIALSDVPQLDGRYAVFGYITEGMDWVDTISIGDRIVSINVIEGLENLSEE